MICPSVSDSSIWRIIRQTVNGTLKHYTNLHNIHYGLFHNKHKLYSTVNQALSLNNIDEVKLSKIIYFTKTPEKYMIKQT